MIGGVTGKEVLKKGYTITDTNLWPLELITTIGGIQLNLQANICQVNNNTVVDGGTNTTNKSNSNIKFTL